jgi:hypothetical protein
MSRHRGDARDRIAILSERLIYDGVGRPTVPGHVVVGCQASERFLAEILRLRDDLSDRIH